MIATTIINSMRVKPRLRCCITVIGQYPLAFEFLSVDGEYRSNYANRSWIGRINHPIASMRKT